MGTYPWMWILLSSAVRVTDKGVRHRIDVRLSKVSVSGKKGEEIVEALLVRDKNEYQTSGNRVTGVIALDVPAISTIQ